MTAQQHEEDVRPPNLTGWLDRQGTAQPRAGKGWRAIYGDTQTKELTNEASHAKKTEPVL